MNLKELAFIFVGGGTGSLVRYGLGKWLANAYATNFPLATLVVNILASLVLGIFIGFWSSRPALNQDLRLLIAVGFCGGFSTFSTFSHETLQLLRTSQISLALLNIALSVGLCVGGTFLGLLVTRNL
jgi:CrcB protein